MKRVGLIAVAFAVALAGCGSSKTQTVTVTSTSSSAATTGTTPTDDIYDADHDDGHHGDVVDARRAAPLHLTMFRSPSANIGCELVPGFARCDIAKRNWSPPPRPASCPLDYGQGLEVGRSGDRAPRLRGRHRAEPAGDAARLRELVARGLDHVRERHRPG